MSTVDIPCRRCWRRRLARCTSIASRCEVWTSTVRRLVRSVAGAPGEEKSERLWEQTEGNPFFVLEVARTVAEGAGDDGWLPEGIREAVGQRLDALGPAVNATLSIASVLGLEFDLRDLAVLSGDTEDVVLDALAVAINAGLVKELSAGRFRFVHALVRSTLYDELGATRRVRRHRQIAEAIEARPDADLVSVAYHWLSAGDSHEVVGRALTAAVDGANDALRRLAFDQASTIFDQALQLFEDTDWDDGELHARLLLGAAEGRGSAGLPYRALLAEAADLAEAAGNTELLVQCALFTPREFTEATIELDEARVDLLHRALARTPSTPSAERALLQSGIAFELAFIDPDTATASATSAISDARRVDDHDALAQVLFNCWVALGPPDLADMRAAVSLEVLSLSERSQNPVLRYRAVSLREWVLFECGDGDGARAIGTERDQLAAALPIPAARWTAGYDRCALVLADGYPIEAEAIADEALAIGEALQQPDAALFHTAAILGIRRTQGRMGELRAGIEMVIDEMPQLAPIFSAVLALAQLQAGEFEQASSIVAAANFADIPRTVTWLSSITCYAEAAAGCGAHGPALELHRLLEPYANLNVYSGATIEGPVPRYLALCSRSLGHFDRANHEFEAALAMADKFGHRYFAATTKLEWGQMLRATQSDRARTLLQQASEQAAVIGADAVSATARAELATLQ